MQSKILKKGSAFANENYRNLMSTFLKDSKQKYFSTYFMKNIKDIKKTWKGIIRRIMTLSS